MRDLTHQAVMTDEVIEALNIQEDGVYIDTTFGRGGHSQAILNKLGQRGRLLALDRDPQAVRVANTITQTDKRFSITQTAFSELASLVEQQGLTGQINGTLFDLGVSSPQLDEAERGFSFNQEGALDMRMDTTAGYTAAEWLAQASMEQMMTVFKEYGEERYARRIAHAITEHREDQPIKTTKQLAEIVAQAQPVKDKYKHPATRVFQALRIFINDELGQLEKGLKASLDALKAGGRLVVISFHSLEDRIVKRFLRDQERGKRLPTSLPVQESDAGKRMRRVGRAIRPNQEEIKSNPRARSAIMRIGEKI